MLILFIFFLMMLNVGGVLPDLVILSHHRDTRRCFLLRRGACFRTKDSDRAAQSRLVLKPRWWKRLEDPCGSPARSK